MVHWTMVAGIGIFLFVVGFVWGASAGVRLCKKELDKWKKDHKCPH